VNGRAPDLSCAHFVCEEYRLAASLGIDRWLAISNHRSGTRRAGRSRDRHSDAWQRPA
jgi:hypothetical protein